MNARTSKPSELHPFPIPKTCIQEQPSFGALSLPLRSEILLQVLSLKTGTGPTVCVYQRENPITDDRVGRSLLPSQ